MISVPVDDAPALIVEAAVHMGDADHHRLQLAAVEADFAGLLTDRVRQISRRVHDVVVRAEHPVGEPTSDPVEGLLDRRPPALDRAEGAEKGGVVESAQQRR